VNGSYYFESKNSEEYRPRLAITIGDAAGIGAEITLKALEQLTSSFVPVVIGDADFLLKCSRKFGLIHDFEVIRKNQSIPEIADKPIIYDLQNLEKPIRFGVESASYGRAAAEYIQTAVRLCKENQVDAIVTAPISKKALQMAGYDFPGHTEFLAHLTGTKDFAMSFFAGNLRTVLLSTHLPLKEAIKLVKKKNLIKLIAFTDFEFRKLFYKKPKIAVAGLNPHASEKGMFGKEEYKEILPAIEYCREEYGIDVSGPYSPDTVFLRAFGGEFDFVVSCYHDQASIAVKCLAFGDAVNVTLGLPFIRTSVDHGTAFEIAGKGVADASSMIAAIRLARDLVLLKRRNLQQQKIQSL
jgi:4-hydroxythreonine-4-phosphate dehydrogenase